MSHRTASFKIALAGINYVVVGSFFGILSPVSLPLAIPAIACISIGVAIIFHHNWARMLARCLAIVASLICVFYLLFLLFFLITTPSFLFFEGGSGIKGLYALLIITPIIIWTVLVLNNAEVKQQFMKNKNVQPAA